MNYPIFEIPDSIHDSIEQLGTKEKFWFYDTDDEKPTLIKFGRPGTGENWSEKATCELAKLIDLPCVEYNFAKWKGREGVISPLFVPTGGRLIHGNEILAKIIDGYPAQTLYKVSAYQLKAVLAIVKVVPQLLPIGYSGNNEIKNPIDLFIGYLIFDCWIANQDRHHENWGIILDTKGNTLHLAPTYDHASGLGCRVSDEERINRLSSSDLRYNIDAFTTRAKSAFYNLDLKRFNTIDVVRHAAKQNKVAAMYWINRIEEATREQISEIFQKIPHELIGEPAITFAIAILESNKNRLLKLKQEFGNGQ
ncbi:MAG: HipA domain-containing protein [Desulfobulbaceae bacterium]|nr:HipA domain-containing protein [Desulfobulbaceae bacterium]